MKIIVPKDLSMPPVPEGVYRVRFNGHKIKQSAKGNSYLSLEFQILTQGPDEKVKTVGRKVWDRATLTEDSLWKMDQLTKAFAGTPLPAGEFTEEELIGKFISILTNKEALAVVSHETYQGQTRETVKEFKPIA